MLDAWTHDFGLQIWRILPDADNRSIALELRDDDENVQFARVWMTNPPRLELPATQQTFDSWMGLQANFPNELLLGEWKDPQFPGITQYYRFPFPDGEPAAIPAKTAQEQLYNQQIEVHLPFARNLERAEPTHTYTHAQTLVDAPLAPHYDELQRGDLTIISVYKQLAADPSGETPGLLQHELLVLQAEACVFQTTLQPETRQYSLDPFSIMGTHLVYIQAQSTLGIISL